LAYVSTLHQARVGLAAAKQSEVIAKEHLQNIPEYLTYTRMVEQRKHAERAVEAQEADVRQIAVELHKETGETHFPGVNIIKGVELFYNFSEAIDYCIQKGYANFLQLDRKAFDKWALANVSDEKIRQQMGLLFVALLDLPNARIDSNLEKAKDEIVNGVYSEQPTE
jgi:hypothetical protein